MSLEAANSFPRLAIRNGNPLEETIGFSRAVRVGPYIAVGGTAPVDSQGRTVGPGDAAAQARQCFRIIAAALEAAGAGWQHVVRSRILLTRIEDWQAVIAVRAEYLSAVRPVDTILQVAGFIRPEWLVEIEVDAIVSDGARPQ